MLLWQVRNAAGRHGLTALAFQLGLRRLFLKRFIEEDRYEGEDRTFDVVLLTHLAWEWIDDNESLFKLNRTKSARTAVRDDFSDDDIPF